MSQRILVIGPAIPYPWLEYTARALARHGHQVVAARYTGWTVNRASSPTVARVAHRVPGAAATLAAYHDRWHVGRGRRLAALADRLRPDLIVVLKGHTLSRETLEALKRAARGPLVAWWVDDPWLFPGVLEGLRMFDHLFIFDRSYLEPLRTLGVPDVRFLPCACDETVYRPMRLSADERRRYASDVALVAWFYANRAAVVNALSDVDLTIWGRGWTTPEARRALTDQGRRRIRRRAFVRDDEACRLYNAAAIGLNIHAAQSRDAGLNTRAFELLAAGTFELTDAVPGMEELLVPGEEVAVYRSPEEARELAVYYLRHADERARLAARGRARVLREHTYACRMGTLLERVQGASRRRELVAV